jgi:hypothetical protein
MSDSYEDIIHLPHPVSKRHAPMSMMNRAAQFAPFSALSGHEAAILEQARYTEEPLEMDEHLGQTLDRQLQWLLAHLVERPLLEITFFQPDERKSGGRYVTTEGILKRLDEYEQCLVLEEGARIPLLSILELKEKERRE